MQPIVLELTAVLDPGLEARLGPAQPLLYSPGPSVPDRLPFVRAASATRRWFGRRVVIQDDVNLIAVGDADNSAFSSVVLPAGSDGGRRFDDTLGNKALKLDLEAAVVLPDGRLLAFGSGSTPVRECLVVVTWPDQVRLVDAHLLYALLREQPLFAGSELNIEGALIQGGMLKLVQRGNGAPNARSLPVNAIGDLPLALFSSWLDGATPTPPALVRITRCALGSHEGAPLSFTDAAPCADGSIACLASAEASPDAVQDGSVYGSFFGLLDESGLRLTPVLDAEGAHTLLKLEGLEPSPVDPGLFEVVADVDRPDVPAIGAQLRTRRR